MNDGMMTIDQAAQLLGVSKDTVRRRIRAGELQAEKQQGPYGEQYFLPESQFDQARIVQDVVPVTRSVTVAELQAVMQKAIAAAVTEAVQIETAAIQEQADKHAQQLQQQVEELKAQLAAAQESQDAHNRSVENQLQLINEPKSILARLFGR